MFQLSSGAGDGGARVPRCESVGARFWEQGEAAYRREVGDEAQPFGMEPVKTWQQAWGRVEQSCGSGFPNGGGGECLEASEDLGVVVIPVHGWRWHRVGRRGEDRKGVVAAVPVTRDGVQIPWMYAEIHPQQEMGGGQMVSRRVAAQREAYIPRRGGSVEGRRARAAHVENFLPGG